MQQQYRRVLGPFPRDSAVVHIHGPLVRRRGLHRDDGRRDRVRAQGRYKSDRVLGGDVSGAAPSHGKLHRDQKQVALTRFAGGAQRAHKTCRVMGNTYDYVSMFARSTVIEHVFDKCFRSGKKKC